VKPRCRKSCETGWGGSTSAVVGGIGDADTSRQVRGPDRSVKELLPEHAADCGWVRHSQRRDPLPDARRAEDGMLFRVFLSLEDLRRLVGRAMEQDETAAIVREIAG